jgi:hypothetical protein
VGIYAYISLRLSHLVQEKHEEIQSQSKKVLSIKLQRRKQAQKSSQVVQKSLMKKKKKKMCRGRELKDVKRERALRRQSSLITHDEEKKKCTERERESLKRNAEKGKTKLCLGLVPVPSNSPHRP